MVRVVLFFLFSALLLPGVATAQSDPRFAEAIAAEENWDRDKATTLLKAACDEDVAGACGRLLGLYIDGGEDDEKWALSSKLCAQADAYACYILGNMASWNSRGPEDKALALSSYQTACEADLPMGCMSFAEMINNGEGGAKDSGKALAIYTESCGKKYGPACAKAADLLESSIWTGETREDAEVAQMHAQVRSLYEKACDNADAEACISLAKMLLEGGGGEKDPVRAMQLMQDMCSTQIRACEQVLRLRFCQP